MFFLSGLSKFIILLMIMILFPLFNMDPSWGVLLICCCLSLFQSCLSLLAVHFLVLFYITILLRLGIKWIWVCWLCAILQGYFYADVDPLVWIFCCCGSALQLLWSVARVAMILSLWFRLWTHSWWFSLLLLLLCLN